MDYDQDNLKLTIYAQQPRKQVSCQKCQSPFFEIHQWHSKSIRVPPLGIYSKVILNLKYPRGHCSLCFKIKPSLIKGVHSKYSHLSCSFVELSGRLMEETTCAAAARWMRCSPSLMWKVDQWRMDHLKKHHYKVPQNLNCEYMSADEVHFLTKKNLKRSSPFSPKWLPEFVTNLVASKHSKIIANASGRDRLALQKCLNTLSSKQRESIKYFAIDMNPSYFSALKKNCPQAQICVDRFHLVQLLNKHVDKVRSQEYRRAQKIKDSFQMTLLGPSKRYLIMENRNNKNTSLEEENMLGKLKALNTNIHNALIIVDYFHKILDQKSIKKFRKSLVKWYQVVRESKSKIFRKFALKIRKYRPNIEAYISSNLTTAVSEGLNNKIKVLKRAGYNYTNKKSFQNKILQRCGYLNSTFIDTKYLFWHETTPQV